MKKCIECGKEKPIIEFPTYKSRKGELMFKNQCKSCNSEYKKSHYRENKQDYLDRAKAQRESDPEGYKKYLNDYYRENREELIEKQKEYYKTPKGMEVRRLSSANYRATEQGAFKESVRGYTFKAIESGKLIRPSHCSICNEEVFVEAHHEDYNQPLEVTWVCKPCHENIHHLNEGQESKSVTVKKPLNILKRFLKE